MRGKLRVGLDFDGVIAYNPFRVVRAPVKWFKRKFLGVKKLKFFVPKNQAEVLVWKLMHESSFFPAKGVQKLKKMAGSGKYEFHLVTARYGFLKPSLIKWLEKNDLVRIFKSISVNDNIEQPHEFKEKVINKLKLDVFVEDNLDIVSHLSKSSKVKVYWIYNIIDRNKKVPNKFPHLEKALTDLEK